MRWNTIQVWLFRILIISLIHSIFKHFDSSFSHFLHFDGRGVAFYIFFLSYGLLTWESGLQLWKRVYPSLLKKLSLSQRLAMLLGIYLLFGAVISLLFGRMYALGDLLIFDRVDTWQAVGWVDFDLDLGIFLFYLMVLGFNGVSFSVKQLQEAELVNERLAKAQLQSDFQALKSQIDPHFFFNSLSVLSSLIYKDPELSDDYIGHLAKMYRYILDNKGRKLVRLKEEIRFLKSYLFLIQIRHQNMVTCHIKLSEYSLEGCLVPPHAVQMLVEHAINHNAFTVEKPLWIEISETENQLLITNRLAIRKNLTADPGPDLKTISERYHLLGSESPIMMENEGHYQVKLEKIFAENYEGFDF